MTDTHDPLHPHSHDPNYDVPEGDGAFQFKIGDRLVATITPAALESLPKTEIADCYIVSTGHGTSGPFRFGGVRLSEVIRTYTPEGVEWNAVAVVSGDGFGNRLTRAEVETPDARPPLLAYKRDGVLLSRDDGLVRLVVPSEIDDALRQVKWVDVVSVERMK